MTNETLETIKNRRSCRAYKPEQITNEELDAVLEAGTYAASAMGRQSAKIVVVQDAAARAQLAGDLQRVQRVAGKTADLLGHDQVDLSQLRRVEHFIELHALVGRCAGKSFVSIDALQLPIRLALDVITEISLLGFKRVRLIFLIRGYAAVRRYL